jgi:hypothetical protein
MCLLLFPLLFQQDPISRLIERLGSDSVEEREAATRQLRCRVDDAQEELEKATLASDPEVAERAREILKTPSPHRLEVRAEMAHLFDHALWSFQKRRPRECIAFCDAMLLIDGRCTLALDLKDSVRKGFGAAPVSGDLSSVRVPPRPAWDAVQRRIRETALAGIDAPDDGSRCPFAVRSRLETLRIDLEFENARLEDVLQLIQDLTGLYLVLDARVVSISDMDRKITCRAHDQAVGESLRQILAESGEEFVVTAEGVVLIRSPQISRDAGLSEPDGSARGDR